MTRSAERKYFKNFGTPPTNIENVSCSLSKQNGEKEDLKREETLAQFPGKINIEIDYFMQYVHIHSLEIAQMLKTRYSSDQQKLCRVKTPKLLKNILTKSP